MNMKSIIRDTLFAFLICIGSMQMVFAQDTIGYIPPGTSIVHNIFDLGISEPIKDTLAFLDIDGDGTQDIQIWLHIGNPKIDDPLAASFIILNNSFSFCTSINQMYRTYLYNLGDTICASGQQWGTAIYYTVACYPALGCIMDSITDQYLAFKKIATDEIGWMRVSAFIRYYPGPNSVSFTISELLALYEGTGINTVTNTFDFEVLPNPTMDGQIFIQCNERIDAIDLFNAQGQILKTYQGDLHDLILPETPGLYFIKIRNEKNQFSIRKIIRL